MYISFLSRSLFSTFLELSKQFIILCTHFTFYKPIHTPKLFCFLFSLFLSSLLEPKNDTILHINTCKWVRREKSATPGEKRMKETSYWLSERKSELPVDKEKRKKWRCTRQTIFKRLAFLWGRESRKGNHGSFSHCRVKYTSFYWKWNYGKKPRKYYV